MKWSRTGRLTPVYRNVAEIQSPPKSTGNDSLVSSHSLLGLKAKKNSNPLRTIAHCDIDAAYARTSRIIGISILG